MKTKKLPPVHPEEIVFYDCMNPLSLSVCTMAKAIGPRSIGISEIIRCKRDVCAEMSLKLGRFFNVSPELRMSILDDLTYYRATINWSSDCQLCVQENRTPLATPARPRPAAAD